MQRFVKQLFTIFRRIEKKNSKGYLIVDKCEHLCYSAYVVRGGVWSRAWVVTERSNADRRKRSLPKRTCPVPQSASARKSCFPPTRLSRRLRRVGPRAKNPRL